uniref:KIB1-4 beta-propeller domain-containing protein n=1 Tax=Arundo donax TaxID=35708 RepID=A0A0A9B609_ARUDO
MICAVLGDPAYPAGGCRIVLYCEDGFFRTCISGATAWDTTPWDRQLSNYPVQLAVVKGRVYALLLSGDLLLFDFMFSFHYLIMRIQDEPNAFRLTHKMGPYLVEHDGKVFTVHCTFLPLPSSPDMVKFRVCQLVKRRWVEQENLNGMALFVDARGSAMLRARPGEWGGKENHVYASGWLWDDWKVFPFGKSIRSDDIPVDNSVEACWPTPHWMLPCSCY